MYTSDEQNSQLINRDYPCFLGTECECGVLGWELNVYIWTVLEILQAIGVAVFLLFLSKPRAQSRYENLMSSEK